MTSLIEKEKRAATIRNKEQDFSQLPQGTTLGELQECLDFAEEFWANPKTMIDCFPLNNNVYFAKNFYLFRDESGEFSFGYKRVYQNQKNGRKAFIVSPVWNVDMRKVSRSVKWSARLLARCDAFVYYPQLRDQEGPNYNILCPDLMSMIEYNWQAARNHKRIVQWLKQEKGYEKIGAIGYSIGTLPLFLSTILEPEIYDCMILHYFPDSFDEALMDGLVTEEIADRIQENEINREDLEKILSVLSPGRFLDYLNNLPPLRLVQAKVDGAFGTKNCGRITKLIEKEIPNVEIEIGDFGHLSYQHLGILKSWFNDGEFMRKHLEVPGII